MEPSELPPFPNPEPPAPSPQPVGRSGTMLLQALFLLAFWSSVYLMHEQAASIVTAREREEVEREWLASTIKNRGLGKWISAAGDGTVLNFTEEELFVTQNDALRWQGYYGQDRSDPHEAVWIWWGGNDTPIYYRLRGDELTCRSGSFFEWLGVVPTGDKTFTFTRLK